jgi:hypothetical protein
MDLPDAPIAREGFFVTHFLTVRDQEKSKDFYRPFQKRCQLNCQPASLRSATRCFHGRPYWPKINKVKVFEIAFGQG